MFTVAHDNLWLTQPFAPVSLGALESKAGMLERIDNKYVVDEHVLRQAIPDLSEHFDMLDIEGCRAFTYDTCYFDDADCRNYFDHHQSRKKRIKVRMRKYLEAGLCFVEVKLKDRRGATVKKRLRTEVDRYGMLDASAEQFVRKVYFDLYHRPFECDIFRNLDMRYKRITLVAKDGGERMTLDNGLQFFMDGQDRAIDESLFVIEAKSAKGNGIADRILRRLHQHPTKHVSKYCTGLASLRDGTKQNNFRRAMRKLGLLEGQTQAAALARLAALIAALSDWSMIGLELV
ncbi:MAG: polyphosphate polymerase domain-containing protein [Rhizobiaceae bacterium]